MSDVHQETKRARTIRTEYNKDVEAVQNWVQLTESKVQTKDVEPQVLQGFLQEIHCEFGAIKNQYERIKTNGALIKDRLNDDIEKKRIETTISSISEQLNHVETWLEERKAQVGSSLDSWQAFLQIYNSLRSWIEKQKDFLFKPLKFSKLDEAKSALYEYKAVVKESKWATRQVNDMSAELIKIGQVSSVSPLTEKLTEIEQEKHDYEGKLKEMLGLLCEMTEEWEQCEQKVKEVATWLQKTSQSLSSPLHKKRSLRDRMAFRESTLSNIAVYKTKLVLALEKLKVHFRDRISADAQVSSELEELQLKLDNMSRDLSEECKALEACVHQMDIYQKDILKLRQNIVDVEQRLRLVSSPSYCALDRDKASAEQSAFREKMKSIQIKISARNERIKLLIQRGIPDNTPIDS